MAAGRGCDASCAALISLKDTSVVCHRAELREKIPDELAQGISAFLMPFPLQTCP